jgi:ribosome maturation factor RimP
MEQTPLLKKVERTIAPMVETMGYEIVRIAYTGAGSSKPTLQIMAERPDGTMLIDDCSRLSQAVSALLDVEDVIEEAYFLEVSSPGIDRPLTRLKDFDRYKDHEVRIELDSPMNGQKKFRGILRGLDGEMILLETDTGDVSLPFHDVFKAKMVLTDELIRASIKAEKDSKKNKKGKGKKNAAADNDEIDDDVAGLPDDDDIEIEDDSDDADNDDSDAPAARAVKPKKTKNGPKAKKNKKTGSK